MDYTKNAQTSLEFIILFGMLFVAATIFMGVLANHFEEFAVTKEENIMKDYGRYLQNEIMLVTDLNDGYAREVFLPEKVSGIDYSISNTKKTFTLISYPSNIQYTYYIPKVEGSLNKGINVISKEGGVIYIN